MCVCERERDGSAYLEHVKVKSSGRVCSSKLQISISETELISRGKTLNFIKPKTGKQV
jgi:hypothetical protein